MLPSRPLSLRGRAAPADPRLPAKGASRSGARRSRAADAALLFGSGAARRPLRPTTTSCLLSHALYFRTWVRPRPTKITQRLGTRLVGRRLGRQRWPTGRGARLVGSSLIRSACAHRPSPAATDLARSSPRRLSNAIRLPSWLGKPSLRRSERRINQRLPEPGRPRPLSKAPGEACNPAALSAGLLVPTRPRPTGVPHYLPRKVADRQTPRLKLPSRWVYSRAPQADEQRNASSSSRAQRRRRARRWAG
jgi:hypothetical protein